MRQTVRVISKLQSILKNFKTKARAKPIDSDASKNKREEDSEEINNTSDSDMSLNHHPHRVAMIVRVRMSQGTRRKELDESQPYQHFLCTRVAILIVIQLVGLPK